MIREITNYSANPDQIIKYSEILLDEAINKGYASYEVDALLTLGLSYRLKGQLDLSLQYLFNSANKASALSNFKLLASVYTEIATTYAKSGNIDQSLEYNNKAIKVFREIGDKQRLSLTLLNTGYQYYNQKKFDSALILYNIAEPIFDSIKLEIGTAYTIGNRALVKWKTGNPKEAIKDLDTAIELLNPLGDNYGKADYYNQLGNIYLELGKEDSAAVNLERGIKLAKSEGLKEQVRDASKSLAMIYSENGSHKQAHDHLFEYVAMRDSIATEEIIQKLADQRADYEINLKQAEIDLSEQRRKTQEIWLYGSFVILSLIVILAVIIYRNYRTKLILSNELAGLNKSKDKLFSIVAHDLKGPMAAFKGVAELIKMAVTNKQTDMLMHLADEVYKTSDQLSALLENLLKWAVKERGDFNVEKEVLSVKALMTDLKETYSMMAEAKNINLIIEEKEVEILADRNMTYTIFRNLVNNALKFTPENGEVTIKCEKESKFVVFKVTDTGIGIPKEKLGLLFKFTAKKSTFGTSGEKGLGLGLSLVEEFVRQNKGFIGVDSKIDEGTEFTLKLMSA